MQSPKLELRYVTLPKQSYYEYAGIIFSSLASKVLLESYHRLLQLQIICVIIG